ncbi:hypothetical protein RBG61_10510 [Paludicola sp. MB14-C6]|uniref:hypothetical protein n=1 Tax=Paludihabitans sp. MB14-C6 TaxID=3070656 RepID=UPI0027DE9E40|nr:hypothetical protein [Paludicola sp. MB14-C6]WMJ22417.1 hypothetical protein RBG61_10510 [Paludicola sp. MB14-C6]
MQKITRKSRLKWIFAVIAIFAITILHFTFNIKSPVLLKHYYDVDAHYDTNFIMSYITNSYDTKKIKAVEFPELKNDNITLSFGVPCHESIKFNYKQCSFYVDVRKKEINSNENLDDIQLTKMKVTYDNGDIQIVDIGKIVLSSSKIYTATEMVSASSSTNNAYMNKVRFKQDVKLNKLSSVLDSELEDALNLQLYRAPLKELKLPIQLKRGEILTVNAAIQFDKNDNRKFNCYNIDKTLYLEDLNGNLLKDKIVGFSYEPYLQWQDYFKLVKSFKSKYGSN